MGNMIYSLHDCTNASEALSVIMRCASECPNQKMRKYHCILITGASRCELYMVWRTKTGWHIEEIYSRSHAPDRTPDTEPASDGLKTTKKAPDGALREDCCEEMDRES